MISAIWTVGFLLQVVLLFSLVRTGAARRLPLFAALIAIYLVRSAALLVWFGHIGAQAYATMGRVFSFVDIVMQIAVGWELFRDGRDERKEDSEPGRYGRRGVRRAVAFCAFCLASVIVAWAISALIPKSGRAPIDRAVILTGVLMLLISADRSLQISRVHSIAIQVLGGFAIVGAASIAVQVGHAYAIANRNRFAYAAWSYVEPLTYMLVVVWWIVAVCLDVRPFRSVSGNVRT